MKFLFSLLAICFSFKLSASSPEINSEEAWSFFTESRDSTLAETSIYIKAHCHLKNHIKYVKIKKNDNDKYCTTFSIAKEVLDNRLDLFYKKYSGIWEKLKELEKLNQSFFFHYRNVVRARSNDSSIDLLKLLYNYEIIPDFVVDRFLQEAKWEDFRIKPNFILKEVEKTLPKEYSFTTFVEAIDGRLSNLTPSREQFLRCEFMKSFSQNNLHHTNSLIEFCEKITDKKQAYYDTSRSILADLYLAKKLAPGESLKKAITALLDRNSQDEDSIRYLNMIVKSFINGGKISTNPLPETLQNLSLNTETVIRLLTHIGALQKKIDHLKKLNGEK